MLTARTLAILADAAESHAEDPRDDTPENRRRVQALRIAAADARAVIDAGSGYGTPETLALAIAVDNDRKMADAIGALVRDHLARYAPGRTPEGLREGASRLADAISEAVEVWAGFEGLTVRGPSSELTGSAGAGYTLPDVNSALAHAGFRAVDWIGLALHYLREAVLQEAGN